MMYSMRAWLCNACGFHWPGNNRTGHCPKCDSTDIEEIDE